MFQGNWEIWLQSNISFIIAVVNRRKCFSSLHRERKIMMGTHTEHKHTRLMETKHSPCGLKSLSREPEREAEAEAACQASSVSYVKLTGLKEEEGRGSCTYTHILLKNHTKRSDHTSRIHPNHTKHTHTTPLSFPSTPPTAFSLMAAGTDCWPRLLWASREREACCCERLRLYRV